MKKFKMVIAVAVMVVCFVFCFKTNITVGSFLLFLAVCGFNVYEIISKNKMKKNYTEELKIANDNLNRMTETEEMLSAVMRNDKQIYDNNCKEYEQMITGLNVIKENYECAKKIHSNLDEEVKEFKIKELEEKDQKIAKEFNEQLDKVLFFCAASENIEKFQEVFKRHLKLNARQRCLINVEKFDKLVHILYQSLEIQKDEKINSNKRSAEIFSSKLRKRIKNVTVGKRTDYDDFLGLRNEYYRLTDEVRKFCSEDLIQRFETLLKEAEADKKRAAKIAEDNLRFEQECYIRGQFRDSFVESMKKRYRKSRYNR